MIKRSYFATYHNATGEVKGSFVLTVRSLFPDHEKAYNAAGNVARDKIKEDFVFTKFIRIK